MPVKCQCESTHHGVADFTPCDCDATHKVSTVYGTFLMCRPCADAMPLEYLKDKRAAFELIADAPAPAKTRTFYVVRVNGHARATYAATTLQEALDITFPTEDARLDVGEVQAPDAGAARLMEPPLGWAGPFTVAELQ